MIHHPWAPAHIAQNEYNDGAQPSRFFNRPAHHEPQRSEDYEQSQESRSPCHGATGQYLSDVGRQTTIRRRDRAVGKLTQQKPPIMFGTLTRETLAMCARRGAICRYYHAAPRFSTPHLTRLYAGTPILRTSRPVVRRPGFGTPLLSEFCIVLHLSAILCLSFPAGQVVRCSFRPNRLRTKTHSNLSPEYQ